MSSKILIGGTLKRLGNFIVCEQFVRSCQLLFDDSQLAGILLRIIKSGDHLLRKNWEGRIGLQVVPQSLLNGILHNSSIVSGLVEVNGPTSRP